MPQKHPRPLALHPQISFPSLPRQLNQHLLRQPNGGHITGTPSVHTWISATFWQISLEYPHRDLHSHDGLKCCRVTSPPPTKSASGGMGQKASVTLLYDPDHRRGGEGLQAGLGTVQFLGQERFCLPEWPQHTSYLHVGKIMFTCPTLWDFNDDSVNLMFWKDKKCTTMEKLTPGAPALAELLKYNLYSRYRSTSPGYTIFR